MASSISLAEAIFRTVGILSRGFMPITISLSTSGSGYPREILIMNLSLWDSGRG